MNGTGQLMLMAGETVGLAILLLTLFRLRHRMGLVPLYLTVGAFQYLQTLLATSIYIEVLPGAFITPGSAVLFPATLAALVLVYIREDVDETQRFILGLLIANVILSTATAVFGIHLGFDSTLNIRNLPNELFRSDPRILVAGTFLLILDAFLIVVLYEAISRVVPWFIARIYLALSLVLAFDSIVFTAIATGTGPGFVDRTMFGAAARLCAAAIYSVAIALYLSKAERRQQLSPQGAERFQGVLQILSYRQKYEALSEDYARDPLTGLYNRRFLDKEIEKEATKARATKQPLSLLLIDIDHFKMVNDSLGHEEGDRVIKQVGQILMDTTRSADKAYRIGGEEFVVTLPSLGHDSAFSVADRIRSRVHRECHPGGSASLKSLTVTIGVASMPGEVSEAGQLLGLADQRMYSGKRSGRNQVVGKGQELGHGSASNG